MGDVETRRELGSGYKYRSSSDSSSVPRQRSREGDAKEEGISGVFHKRMNNVTDIRTSDKQNLSTSKTYAKE